MESKEYNKPYTCNGCKELGFGFRYRCEKCDFDLHQLCMFPDTSLFAHEFFPGSTFEFLTTPTKRRQCDACGMNVNGFVYHCKKDDLNLHPCCGNLKEKLHIKLDDDKDKEMVLNLNKEMRGKCTWCKDDHGNGWSYMFECGKHHIHVARVTQTVLEKWKRREDSTKDHDSRQLPHN